MINYNHPINMFFIWFQNIRFESHGMVWHLYIKLVSKHVHAFKIPGLGLVDPHDRNFLCLFNIALKLKYSTYVQGMFS
jgi:hypothetical protein